MFHKARPIHWEQVKENCIRFLFKSLRRHFQVFLISMRLNLLFTTFSRVSVFMVVLHLFFRSNYTELPLYFRLLSFYWRFLIRKSNSRLLNRITGINATMWRHLLWVAFSVNSWSSRLTSIWPCTQQSFILLRLFQFFISSKWRFLYSEIVFFEVFSSLEEFILCQVESFKKSYCLFICITQLILGIFLAAWVLQSSNTFHLNFLDLVDFILCISITYLFVCCWIPIEKCIFGSFPQLADFLPFILVPSLPKLKEDEKKEECTEYWSMFSESLRGNEFFDKINFEDFHHLITNY